MVLSLTRTRKMLSVCDVSFRSLCIQMWPPNVGQLPLSSVDHRLIKRNWTLLLLVHRRLMIRRITAWWNGLPPDETELNTPIAENNDLNLNHRESAPATASSSWHGHESDIYEYRAVHSLQETSRRPWELNNRSRPITHTFALATFATGNN